ncbi:flavin reductase, partial [Escherichia coli]|uniref:flavin reductase family protein n=2 Tax=Escherichia coli TaxID=562 RepID=UPI001FFFEBBE|nr:flavin reductase [Escherichia coli]
MSRFIPIELHHASRLLNHGPTVMITSFDEQSQRRNIMAAAWSMPVEFEPPRVAIVVDKSTWTRELIERNGKFGIVIPGAYFHERRSLNNFHRDRVITFEQIAE